MRNLSTNWQEKPLDRAREYDIIMYTHFATQERQVGQARSASATRMPESSSGAGGRSTVRTRRVLRCQRSGPSQVQMLRSVQIEQKPISQAAAAFGFSRPTYYQAEMDFQNRGLSGLLPEKRGPRKAHKLTAEVLGYAQQLRSEQPSL